MFTFVTHDHGVDALHSLVREAAEARPASLAALLAGRDLPSLCVRLGCGAETARRLMLDDQPSYDGAWDLAVGEIALRHGVDAARLASLVADAQWGDGRAAETVARVA